MKHARLLCTPIVLALLCAVPRVAADIGDNPGVPVTVKSPNESPNSCCNDWFGWGPFRIGDPQTWYWGWRYCCILGSDPNHGHGCDKSKPFNIGRGGLSVYVGGNCGDQANGHWRFTVSADQNPP
ncbi:uncharacterized protein SETTUDRAFT_38724 [Exserohilum turcica Et28A]|uniref:Secreted protein n=1 Tax=Exserohilum turcicum (strain 28A) TaxID=671987 RepID=R0KJ50_EXST2|nr:uncharacterized protein SETTUDRAFT_38724 [Exserohilum turcica Et28A]EOA88037.1 hypothetical protein SETTUDRAFT_38724 [Exserohilum turcica Et28A]